MYVCLILVSFIFIGSKTENIETGHTGLTCCSLSLLLHIFMCSVRAFSLKFQFNDLGLPHFFIVFIVVVVVDISPFLLEFKNKGRQHNTKQYKQQEKCIRIF